MGRERRSTFEDLAALAGPGALIVGASGYTGIRYCVPALFAGIAGPLAQVLAATHGLLAPLARVFLGGCAFASLALALRARWRRNLLAARTGLDSLAALDSRDFERLVGEAFRRQRYAVEETGLGRTDDGIDPILRRGSQRILVPCKQWRRQKALIARIARRPAKGLTCRVNASAERTLPAKKCI